MDSHKVENSKLYQFLLSEENIYLAIYAMESYIFEYDLLDKKDKIIYQKLKDKLNEKYIINDIIPKVKVEIERLILNKDAHMEVEVYFKPKKYEKGKVEYRPLHTTTLVNQIVSVAMLNLLIYEITDSLKNDGQKSLSLSNLSRLVPSNFYGNRVSLKPKELFKPWKEQYQKYTSLTNEYLKKYHNSLEYKYEVILDLQKFFPSVNPEFIRQYILEKLPANLVEEDEILYDIILEKLLYCKIKNKLSSELWEEYYFDIVSDEILEKKDWSIFQEFTKGIPQGLPQSYFFGNIAMIPIAEQFTAQFPGKSLFYVDDSVLFTNELEESTFLKSLEKLNNNIESMTVKILQKRKIVLSKPLSELEQLYKIKVHESDKSYYIKLNQTGDGEIFLMCLSREASHATSDMFRLYSDEEDNILKERMLTLSSEVKKKIDELSERIKNIEEIQQQDGSMGVLAKYIQKDRFFNEKKDRYTKFIERLNRYYKFFKYRYIRLELMETNELEELEKIIFKQDDNQDFLEWFVDVYKNNIWITAVSIYRKRVIDKEKIDKLKRYIRDINKALFKYNNRDSSYLYKVYTDLLHTNQELDILEIKPYDSLKKIVTKKLANYRQKHYSVVEGYINDILGKKSRNEIMSMCLSNELCKCISIVDENTEEIFRMILNSIYSYLFSVEIEDEFIINKKNKKPLSYGELRLLLFIRNPLFTEAEFRKQNILLSTYNNQLPVDSSILEVTEAFRTFVKAPVFIDNLILTHQYICDIWKNGSKYLYFYTLHNQEHAIELIKNVIKIIHAFDYFQISSLDYYIIFLACYLHDIAMVKIPDFDNFLLNEEEADEIVYEFEKTIKEKKNSWDSVVLKRILIDFYKKIDSFYEKQVREQHGANSAAEIRNVKDLSYLDPFLREFVAEVAAAHVYETSDVYFAKSVASNKAISIKFDKILLRLADALDMSMYRISRPILYHNLEHMQEEAAFHWISHSLVKGYELKTIYEVDENEKTLTPGSIVEKVILKVYVEMSQLSKYSIKEKCSFARINRETLTAEGKSFDLECGMACSPEGECNFLCKWFTEKNKYLLKELEELNQYLKRIPDNFFGSSITVRIEMIESTKLDANQFELIKRYIER